MSGIYNFLLLCPVIWISNKYGYIYQKLLKIWPYLSEMLILFTSRRLCLLKMFSVRKEVRISKLIVLSSAALGEVQCIELRRSLIHRTSTVLILLTESFSESILFLGESRPHNAEVWWDSWQIRNILVQSQDELMWKMFIDNRKS